MRKVVLLVALFAVLSYAAVGTWLLLRSRESHANLAVETDGELAKLTSKQAKPASESASGQKADQPEKKKALAAATKAAREKPELPPMAERPAKKSGPPPKAEKQQPSPKPEAPKKAVKPGVIRLSAIAKRPAGEEENIFVNPRSDMDLWKDNPVEADLKYKGKKVEVEVEADRDTLTGRLSIHSRADGLAFILTPGDLPLQAAAFVFRGDNSKQLVGLQKFVGTLVIRGECKGIDRGRVVFEDCIIAAKRAAGNSTSPETTQKEVKKVRPASPQKSAEFDPNDLQRTARWAAAMFLELSKARGNAIRLQDTQTKLLKEMGVHVGKKVKWTFKVVDEVQEKYVPLQSTVAQGGLVILRVCSGANTNSVLGACNLPVGDGISREKAGKLRVGSVVVLTAEVASVDFMDPALGPFVKSARIVLKNLRAE